MLPEICKEEALPVGYTISEGHHLSCINGHSYAMTTKTMAVGNPPEHDGPDDAFLVTPVPVFDGDTFIRWDKGDTAKPLDAPYLCPECSEKLGIS